MKLLVPLSSISRPTSLFFLFTANPRRAKPICNAVQFLQFRAKGPTFTPKMVVKACVKVEQKESSSGLGETNWGKVSAVLFDMDGVLCNSEEPSRMAAVDIFAEMGVQCTVEDFVPFTGTGEANFLEGVARVKGVKDFDVEAAKKRFFEIYLDKYAKPNSGIGFPGALELITRCKEKGLKVAVASSADRVKVDANLAAAGLPLSLFDAIVSADAFENLKPAPDIFLAASKILDVPTNECVVIEDALAGIQAANAAQMRCIAVKTSVAEESLKNAGPSFIRNNIGNISIDDILGGGSDASKTNDLEETSNGPIRIDNSSNDKSRGFRDSRRNVLRYASLGVALSCLYFTVTNWKAMQYASPQAIWNLLFGVSKPDFELNKGNTKDSQVQQFVEYISDLEARY